MTNNTCWFTQPGSTLQSAPGINIEDKYLIVNGKKLVYTADMKCELDQHIAIGDRKEKKILADVIWGKNMKICRKTKKTKDEGEIEVEKRKINAKGE
jgi:hypothetical protein